MPYAPVVNTSLIGQGLGPGLASAGDSISKSLMNLGMMHLQDKQASSILQSFKDAGMDKTNDPAIKALLTFSDKGPLGSKSAALSLLQNQLSMQYQMRLAGYKYGLEGGGISNPPSGGNGNQGGSSGNSGYDLSGAPPPNPNSSGLNLSGGNSDATGDNGEEE